MSEEHKHHNDLFQTNNQDDLLGETELHERSYPKTGDGGVYGDATAAVIEAQMEEYEKKEAKEHKNVGELGALPSNAFALQEAKNDPQHAHTHKTDEETAATARVGAGGFALHDHHEKKEAKE